MSHFCCDLNFFFSCIRTISNQFCFPVTLHYCYSVVFQNWRRVFTGKKNTSHFKLLFCLAVVLLLMLLQPLKSVRGTLGKLRRRPGWRFPAWCPPARYAAGRKSQLFSYCCLPEVFPPVKWINLPAKQLTGRVQTCHAPETHRGIKDLNSKMQKMQQVCIEKAPVKTVPCIIPFSVPDLFAVAKHILRGKASKNK